MGTVPVLSYWTTGDRTHVDIPCRETREFIAFLLDDETKQVRFCSAVYPEFLPTAPLWQIALPFGTGFGLTFIVQSPTARSTGAEFYLHVSGSNGNKIQIIKKRSFNVGKEGFPVKSEQ
jgi:hypothetical protein